MTFEDFWKENYEDEFGECEPYYGIASYAFESGQKNCGCVHTDNSAVIELLKRENKKLKKDLERCKKALALYVNWAEECNFGYDNLEKLSKKYGKEIDDKELGYCAGLMYIALREAEGDCADHYLNGLEEIEEKYKWEMKE